MRKPAALVISLVLVSAFGMATVEIVQPSEGTITTDALVPLNVTTDINESYANYSLNGGPEQFCTCLDPEKQASLTLEQGYNMINVTVYGNPNGNSVTQTAGVRTYVDTKNPTIESIAPTGRIFDLTPTVDVAYADQTSGINTSQVSVRLDGNETVGEGTVDADGFTYTPSKSLAEGRHSIAVTVFDTVGNKETADATFTLPEKPVLSEWGVNGTVATRSPEITIRARDPSGIDIADSSITVSGVVERNMDVEKTIDLKEEHVEELDGTEDIRVTYGGLSLPADGRYRVTANVEDDSADEHEEEREWFFTADTESPRLTEMSHTDGDIISGDEDVWVVGSDDLSRVASATFQLGTGLQRQVTDQEDGRFETRLDTRTADEGRTLLKAFLLDSVGNLGPASGPRTVNVTVDNTPPQFTSAVEVYPETAASHVRVRGVVEDAAAGVEEVTYAVNGSDISGDLSAADGAFDERRERFVGVVDVSSLAGGQHTLYLRSEDVAGHRSAKAGATFTRDDGATASLTFVDPANVTVERGKEVSVEYAVRNTGDVAEYVSLSAASERNVTVETGERKVEAGETKRFRVSVRAGRNEGTFPLRLRASGLATSAVWEGAVIVQPRPAEQQRIRDRFQSLKERYSELNRSRQEYGFEEAKALDTKLSSTGQAVAEIDRLLGQGRYRAAEKRLDETETLVKGTQSTFTGQVTRYRVGQAGSMLLHLVLFVVASFATVFGYRTYRGEEESSYRSDSGIAGVEDIRERVRDAVNRIHGRDEDAGPEAGEWQGFNG